MCVLLVEDEELIRTLLTEVMTDAGFEVIEAPDAKIALGLAKAMLLPEAIVTDVNLGPGMDGFALVAAARCWWPAVPVLMISGMATNFAGRHRNTAERFLLKPFSLSDFMRNVSDLAGKPGQ